MLAKLQIWDTAGQEKWSPTMGSSYYRGADCCVLVYDATMHYTLDSIKQWLADFVQYTGVNVKTFPFIFIGNKIDMTDDICVTAQEGQEYADNLCKNNQHYRVSAKTGEGVNEAFDGLAQLVVSGLNLETSVTQLEDKF